MSVYEEVGGAPTFERLVHAFYVGVAGDPEHLVEIDFSGRHGLAPNSAATGAAGTGGRLRFHRFDQFLASSSTSENSASTTSSSELLSDAASVPSEPCAEACSWL